MGASLLASGTRGARTNEQRTMATVRIDEGSHAG